jgi:hypothetical protein
MIDVSERHRGTRGSDYYYVVEEGILRHIGLYSTQGLKHDDRVHWDIPLDRVTGKRVIWISFTNSGGQFLSETRIERFKGGTPQEATRLETLEQRLQVLKGLEAETIDQELVGLIAEFKSLYTLMTEQVKGYSQELDFEITFAKHAARVEEAYKGGIEGCLLSCLALPTDRSRKMSLNSVCKWLYQIWTLMWISRALKTYEVKKPDWRYRQ